MVDGEEEGVEVADRSEEAVEDLGVRGGFGGEWEVEENSGEDPLWRVLEGGRRIGGLSTCVVMFSRNMRIARGAM